MPGPPRRAARPGGGARLEGKQLGGAGGGGGKGDGHPRGHKVCRGPGHPKLLASVLWTPGACWDRRRSCSQALPGLGQAGGLQARRPRGQRGHTRLGLTLAAAWVFAQGPELATP